MEKLRAAATERKSGLIFCNLVDFDMLYGHRKDVEGFAKSLEEFDTCSGFFAGAESLRYADDHRRSRLRSRSALANHRPFTGVCTDSGVFTWRRRGVNLGVRDTLADMGQTIAEIFGGTIPHARAS